MVFRSIGKLPDIMAVLMDDGISGIEDPPEDLEPIVILIYNLVEGTIRGIDMDVDRKTNLVDVGNFYPI